MSINPDLFAEYWAEVDENDIVVRVIRADLTFVKSGAVGDFDNWYATSKDGTIRKNYAGAGYTYNRELDAFVEPKEGNYPDSWVLNSETAQWEAPVAHPDDGESYTWNEETQSWDAVETE
jgi:hypothetical protein